MVSVANQGGRDCERDNPPAGTVPALVLDLGTNAEIALWTGSQWLVTSTAAGPAFEAGNIACGMPLAPGAVTDVQLRGDRLELAVAGGGSPTGLCGSGLLALIVAARGGDLLDAGGRIVAPDEVGTNLARYLVADGSGWALCFHRDARGELCLTQDDVRQLQLAKGAVRAGVEVLLDRAGLTAVNIDTVLITGAFGAALPVAALKGIAMLPEGMIDKAFFVPNGVLDGLATFLADPDGAAKLTKLLATIKPLPLSGTPAFEKRFLAALEF
ncbi:MAG: ATP-binding protein [Desulfuromonadales bacterium]|nr:ATP-binding protein [Desulfuromonadales bacterium]